MKGRYSTLSRLPCFRSGGTTPVRLSVLYWDDFLSQQARGILFFFHLIREVESWHTHTVYFHHQLKFTSISSIPSAFLGRKQDRAEAHVSNRSTTGITVLKTFKGY